MKIVYLASGAAGMYCGTCLHDNTLARALLKRGAEVLLTPVYTPIKTDEVDVSGKQVLMGGINMYLQQALPLFRHTPRFIDRLFDSRGLLGWLSRMQFSVQAEKLGPLTISMLRGEEGNQRKEVARLVDWLAQDVRPDVVHLSNALLIGVARPLKQRLGVPVVCSLSGEDVFLDKLLPQYIAQAREAIRQRATYVDTFVALNNYYADYMARYMNVDRNRIEVIAHGLDLEGYAPRRPDRQPSVTTIGYFARICHDKGLHLLVDAFQQLVADGAWPELRLEVAGYLAKSDRQYLAAQQAKAERHGFADRFAYRGELSRADKIEFLQSLDVMSVPGVYCESKGLSLIEALASGVPLVVPDHGVCPELIGDTGGGTLFKPGDVDDLAGALRQYVTNPQQAIEHGARGRQAVHQRYHAELMAQRTFALYQRLVVPSAEAVVSAPGS